MNGQGMMMDEMGGAPAGNPMSEAVVNGDRKNLSPLNKVDFAKLVQEGALTPDMTIDEALNVFGMNSQMTMGEVMPFWKDLKMKASPTFKAMKSSGMNSEQMPPTEAMPAETGGLDKLLGGM